MSNKSKALASKAFKRSKKILGTIERNKDLYIQLAKMDSEEGNKYIEDNFNEDAFKSLEVRLDKFKEDFEESGGNAEYLQGLVFGSIFLDRALIKDMLKSCK